jgi:nitrite reductase/ring-hydroxylating ferredoxin subunit
MSDEELTRRQFLACGCLAIALGPAGGRLLSASSFATGLPSGRERVYAIPAADGVTVDTEAQLLLVRHENKAFAFGRACPHQAAAIRWVPARGQFQCTKHDSRFGAEGERLSGVAPRGLDRYGIRREGDRLVVDLDRTYRSNEDPAGWTSASAEV